MGLCSLGAFGGFSGFVPTGFPCYGPGLFSRGLWPRCCFPVLPGVLGLPRLILQEDPRPPRAARAGEPAAVPLGQGPSSVTKPG